jgi:integrase
MARHLLTDRHVRNAKPRASPYRLFDGEGLALWISPTGAKSWQLRYRLDGTEQTATLGKLDRLTLAEARVAANVARKLADQGEHLTLAKRAAKLQRKAEAANTFRAFAEAWTAREARRMRWSADYRAEVAASLRNHLSPLDPLPVTKITAAIASPALLAVERTAPQMLEKVRRRLRAILDDAVEQGVIAGNPLPAVRRRKNPERRHFPAVVKLPELGAILREARASDPCKGIARAHLLLAFTALRVSEVVGAQWEEFNLDGADVPIGDSQRTRRDPAAGNWSVPRERMKRKDAGRGPHVVPLSPKLLAALREWREADGEGALYVCPAPRDPSRPITPEGVEKFYRNALVLGGKHSPHSWRSAFSTVCREAGKDGDAVESQLDHVVGNKIAAAYDRAKRLQLRRDLMRWYEAQLIAARDGAAVVKLARQSGAAK